MKNNPTNMREKPYGSELDTVEGIERYRISSIEPNLLTDGLIDFVAASRRFMPHGNHGHPRQRSNLLSFQLRVAARYHNGRIRIAAIERTYERPAFSVGLAFGCKLNFAETASVARLFEERGVKAADKCEVPDFIVITRPEKRA